MGEGREGIWGKNRLRRQVEIVVDSALAVSLRALITTILAMTLLAFAPASLLAQVTSNITKTFVKN